MDPLELLLAGLVALAILLIALAVASRGGEPNVEDRVQRYGSGKELTPARAANRANFATLIGESDTMSAIERVVGRRDFGSNIARDLARADVQLKVSEFL